ncbi:MAG TPA: hypothetical protein VF790_00335 [Dissulfurispiraceae bacterium]
MGTAFAPLITMKGRTYDLTVHFTVKRLLCSRKGRRAIVGWMNANRASRDYEKVYSVVAGLTSRGINLVEPVVATATAAACMLSPAITLPLNTQTGWTGICKRCHTESMTMGRVKKVSLAFRSTGAKEYSRNASFIKKGVKGLTFVNLGTRGRGVSAVDEVRETEGTDAGKVAADGLLFRNGHGMRLTCEFGKYPPKGSEVVLGMKSYRMVKNGSEWKMRNVISVNGIPTGGDVFIAEHYVKLNAAGKKVLQAQAAPQDKSSLLDGIKARYSAPQAKTFEEIKNEVKEIEKSIAENRVLVKEGGPLAAGKDAGKEENELAESPADNRVITREQKDSYEVTLYIGGLSVTHVFRNDSHMTFHEVFPRAYPKISLHETINVPLEKVKKDVSRYLMGIDGQLEKNMLTLIHKELSAMLGNSIIRQLPAPDGRIISDVKIIGQEDSSRYVYIYLSLGRNSGEWVAINDDYLVKIMQSEAVPSYTANRAGK